MHAKKGSQLKSLVRTVAVLTALLTMAMVVSTSQVSAQTPEPLDDPYAVFTELSGFESGVARSFSTSADQATAIASPEATPTDDSAASGQVTRLTTIVLQFDTDANATAGMTKIQTEIQGDSAATALIVGDLGDKKAAFALEDETGTVTSSAIVVQAADQVIVVLTEGSDSNSATLATEIAKSIVETEAGTGEPQFSPDGTSTGGAWDRLPTADDSSLSDLPIVEDNDLQPIQL